jgi:hypothetical protein
MFDDEILLVHAIPILIAWLTLKHICTQSWVIPSILQLTLFPAAVSGISCAILVVLHFVYAYMFGIFIHPSSLEVDTATRDYILSGGVVAWQAIKPLIFLLVGGSISVTAYLHIIRRKRKKITWRDVSVVFFLTFFWIFISIFISTPNFSMLGFSV